MPAETGTALPLSPDDVVAEGRERLVFVHPENAQRLIKVIKPQRAEAFRRMTFGDLTQRYIASARWRPLAKQTAEYTRLMLKHQGDPDFVPPISHLYGFQPTTLGMGCVTERVTDAAGDNAPTLESLLAQDALTSEHLKALNGTVARLYALGVRAGDLNAGNFVFGHRHIGPSGHQTPAQWVIVDGFGDLHAIPARSWSHWTNAIGLDDCFHRMSPKIPLHWNKSQRQFERPT